MSAVPIFDERRREFVERRPEPPPPAKPESSAPAVRTSGPASSSVALVPTVPMPRLPVLQAYLRRLRHKFDDSGEVADAQIIGELIVLLGGSENVKAAALESDHQPIYAVCAAYITALTNISTDETQAAQLLARKLITQGYALPRQGGDTRGWKRLLWWRDQLERGRLPGELRNIYERTLKFALQAPNDIDLKAALENACDLDPSQVKPAAP